MPLVTIEYNLPEEEPEYWEANNGKELSLCIAHVNEALRNIIRYNHDELSEEMLEGIGKARDILHEELTERGLVRVLG